MSSTSPALPAVAARAAEAERSRLCFVGPLLGVNPGWVTSQGEIVAGLLADEGYAVRQTSHVVARLPRLADILRSLVAWRGEIDVVVHQVFSGPAFGITDAASLLGRALGLRQVFALHGGSLPEFAAAHPRWTRRVLARADRVVAPSGYLLERVVRPLFPRAATNWARVIPNILDLSRYTYRHRPSVAPRLLWMRTFADIYEPGLAVEVLADLRQTHPAATLTMAGQEKGLRDEVMALARQRGLGEAVAFPGFLDEAGKAREFAAHDIFLNTNRVDNTPVSVLEAAACGLPIVATAAGGIPHLLRDGETGLLVPVGDATAMTAAARRLLGEPMLAAALSANGRRLAESCAWPNARPLWDALFDEVRHA
jgi:glycosyltransferase involved in cell wall biosynthesis